MYGQPMINKVNPTGWIIFKEHKNMYRKTPNISCILLGNKIVDHSDVVGAAPIGAAPTTSAFTT